MSEYTEIVVGQLNVPNVHGIVYTKEVVQKFIDRLNKGNPVLGELGYPQMPMQATKEQKVQRWSEVSLNNACMAIVGARVNDKDEVVLKVKPYGPHADMVKPNEENTEFSIGVRGFSTASIVNGEVVQTLKSVVTYDVIPPYLGTKSVGNLKLKDSNTSMISAGGRVLGRQCGRGETKVFLHQDSFPFILPDVENK